MSAAFSSSSIESTRAMEACGNQCSLEMLILLLESNAYQERDCTS